MGTEFQGPIIPIETVNVICGYAPHLDVSVDALFEGVPFTTETPRRLTWSEFARIHLNIERLAGSDEQLLALGPSALEVKEIGRLSQACGLVISPQTYYSRPPHFVLPRLIPPMRVKTCSEDGWVIMELSLPGDIEPCRAVFVLIAGLARVAPKLLGLAEAEVRFEAGGHRAVIRVLPPSSRTIWARIRRPWAWFRNAGAAYHELEAQHHALQEAVHQKEQALLDRQRALDERERALRIRDRFLQSMGHELRTPINGLLNSIDALREPDDLDDPKAVLEAATSSAARLVAAVDATLSYAKVTSETLVVRPVPARPADVLHAVAKRLAALARGASVDLRAQALPGAEVWRLFDDSHAQRALGELIRNAIQVSKPGQSVEVISRLEDDCIVFEVLDRGPPRPVCTQTTVLADAVEQFDLSPSNPCLGFEIAEAKAEAMNGRLALSSRPDGVNVSRLELPAGPVTNLTHLSAAKSRRVLAVDDDRINRMVAKRLLRKLNCEVAEAIDGAQAIEIIKQTPFDLVLMDCEMPVLDGWAATQRIRNELGLLVPIVAATAYASESDRLRCADAGMDDFLAKPLDSARLAVVLDKWLRG